MRDAGLARHGGLLSFPQGSAGCAHSYPAEPVWRATFYFALDCAELYALGYRANAKKLDEIDDLLNELMILEFDDACAREYGRLHARLAERGRKAGRADLMIAATALVHGLVLVTHDKDFLPVAEAVPELHLEDWLT